ncbi:MAG: hypothetical protein HC806_08295 [Anaerolineae bacterium]|nr:hypothetical protein [Anaerolineae bacterium]
MQFQFSSFSVPLFVVSAISILLVIYIWRQRNQSGAVGLFALTLAGTIWATGYAFEIAGTDLATKVFWAKIQYFGITTVPLSWLVFALQFTNRNRWLTPRNVILLGIIPFLTLALVLSNESHGSIWPDYQLDSTGPFLALEVSHGIGFWVYWIYSQVLVLAGTFLILRTLYRTQKVYQVQGRIILVAVLIPWFGNAVYLSGINPIPQLDLTPFGFVLSAIALAWGVFRHRLVDLTPIAREIVIENLNDGVIVLDQETGL